MPRVGLALEWTSIQEGAKKLLVAILWNRKKLLQDETPWLNSDLTLPCYFKHFHSCEEYQVFEKW